MALIQPLIGSNLVTGAADFDSTLIGNSIWLDGSADFLNRQNGSDFANRKEVTLSFWVQRNKFASQQAIFAGLEGGTGFIIQFRSDDTFQLYLNGTANLATDTVYRDVGWYHILVSIDTSQAVSSDRSKVFINGVQLSSFTHESYPVQDSNIFGISGQMTSSENMRIGNYNNGSSNFYFHKGYVTQACMIESKSIQQGDFAVSNFLDTFTFDTNGSQFIPKKDSDIAALASAAGGNSFCLDFADSSDLGNDISTNNNDFTPTSMASANQSNHSPSLVYPTMNPLNDVSTVVLSEGNTRVNAQSSASIRSTAFAAAGKRYAELTVTAVGNSYLGVAVNGTNPTSFAATGAVACQQGGDIYVSSSSPSGNKCPAYTTGDVLGILIDVDADKFWVSKNGTFHSMDRNPTITLTASQVLAGTGGFDLTALGSGGSYAIHVGNSDGTAANVLVNFGQYTFSHTPPTGYLNWASNNFDTLTFSNPATGSFTGNASTDGSFVFLGFQPSPSDALTINSNSVTYGTDVDLCNNGFKVRSSSSNFNSTGTNTYSLVTTNALQINGELPPSYGITN